MAHDHVTLLAEMLRAMRHCREFMKQHAWLFSLPLESLG